MRIVDEGDNGKHCTIIIMIILEVVVAVVEMELS